MCVCVRVCCLCCIYEFAGVYCLLSCRAPLTTTPRLQVYDEDSICFVNNYHTDSFL